jgi:hypothetical protein
MRQLRAPTAHLLRVLQVLQVLQVHQKVSNPPPQESLIPVPPRGVAIGPNLKRLASVCIVW